MVVGIGDIGFILMILMPGYVPLVPRGVSPRFGSLVIASSKVTEQ